MNKEDLGKVLDLHSRWWASDGAEGEIANLRGANLEGAYLVRADLRGADLEGAYLVRADLRGANLAGAYLVRAYLEGAYLVRADLRGADLEGAYLVRADLRVADLRGADLRGADLRWVVGNGREVKSLQCGGWGVIFTSNQLCIGCQSHPIVEWWGFSDERIDRMDRRALEWWKVWKPILQKIIEVAPAG